MPRAAPGCRWRPPVFEALPSIITMALSCKAPMRAAAARRPVVAARPVRVNTVRAKALLEPSVAIGGSTIAFLALVSAGCSSARRRARRCDWSKCTCNCDKSQRGRRALSAAGISFWISCPNCANAVLLGQPVRAAHAHSWSPAGTRA